eukprot:scaffold16425_cov52-Attheya_sp.AAC.1
MATFRRGCVRGWILMLLFVVSWSSADAKRCRIEPQLQHSRTVIRGGEQQNPHPNHNSLPLPQLVELYEVEEWNGEQWLGSREGRWVDEQKDRVDPPPRWVAPARTEFDSDWKIAVTPGDPQGWQYYYRHDGTTTIPDSRNPSAMTTSKPQRRRKWLRTLRPIITTSLVQEKEESTRSSTATTVVKGADRRTAVEQKKKRKRRSFIRETLGWNFKGWGFGLYKSMVFAQSFGVLFRLPLSINFDAYERHPEWPSVTSSLGFWFPSPSVSATLNLSLPMELLNVCGIFCLQGVGGTCWNVLALIQWTIVKVLQTIWNIILLPYKALQTTIQFTLWLLLLSQNKETESSTTVKSVSEKERNSKSSEWTLFGRGKPSLLISPNGKVLYSTEVSNRLGVCVTWRLSVEQGYEIRYQWWHCYVPTLVYHEQSYHQTKQFVQRRRQTSRRRRRRRRRRRNGTTNQEEEHETDAAVTAPTPIPPSVTEISEWLRQKTASLGLSTCHPIPDPPFFSTSAIFSLSGLYLRPLFFPSTKSNSNNNNPTTPSTTTSATTSQRSPSDSSNSSTGDAKPSPSRTNIPRLKDDDDSSSGTTDESSLLSPELQPTNNDSSLSTVKAS